MTGGRRAKKREFSKTIISAVGAVTIVVTAFTLMSQHWLLAGPV